jgi:hypothetical protein
MAADSTKTASPAMRPKRTLAQPVAMPSAMIPQW